MSFTPFTAQSLTLLGQALDEPFTDLQSLFVDLATSIRHAVSSYVGLSLSVRGVARELHVRMWGHDDDAPVVLPSVLASLALPLAPHQQRQTEIVVYAARAGAFVDLAADLAVLTSTALSDMVIDQHLTHSDPRSQGDTVQDASTVNQAVGVLLSCGWTGEEALRVLDERAAVHGSGRLAVAAELLDELGDGVAGWWTVPP